MVINGTGPAQTGTVRTMVTQGQTVVRAELRVIYVHTQIQKQTQTNARERIMEAIQNNLNKSIFSSFMAAE